MSVNSSSHNLSFKEFFEKYKQRSFGFWLIALLVCFLYVCAVYVYPILGQSYDSALWETIVNTQDVYFKMFFAGSSIATLLGVLMVSCLVHLIFYYFSAISYFLVKKAEQIDDKSAYGG